jgi:HEAT repeat protein
LADALFCIGEGGYNENKAFFSYIIEAVIMSKHIEQPGQAIITTSSLSPSQQESIQAALALLIGSETEYHMRTRAARRLARQGPAILPILLTTLNSHPEITTPAWPWWPPQYEQCSHLLAHLGQQAHIQLTDIPNLPTVTQPIGPVLWISIIEAMSHAPHEDTEEFLCKALNTEWNTVRYAAAMALSTHARHAPLHPDTRVQLLRHLDEQEALAVRLTAAYALLNNGENMGLETLLQLMTPEAPEEARKAATFILATELPVPLPGKQNERLVAYLINLLQDSNAELAMHAAQALSKIAEPALLGTLSTMLSFSNIQGQIMILTALEEMATRKAMRYAMHQKGLPSRVLPLLQSPHTEIRQQVCYTLAACGGEYATAALGTIIHYEDHPAHLEAIESLRVLHGALKMSGYMNAVHWLVQLLSHPAEETRGVALDSLVYLLRQARLRGHKQVWRNINWETIKSDVIMQIMHDTEAWVRQRAIELVRLLGNNSVSLNVLNAMLHLLETDSDSGVRASIAYTCGQLGMRWAIPVLIQTLRDPNEHVALTALNALGQLATPNDTLIQSALMELIQANKRASQVQRPLVQQAQSWLRKLRRASKTPSSSRESER